MGGGFGLHLSTTNMARLHYREFKYKREDGVVISKGKWEDHPHFKTCDKTGLKLTPLERAPRKPSFGIVIKENRMDDGSYFPDGKTISQAHLRDIKSRKSTKSEETIAEERGEI